MTQVPDRVPPRTPGRRFTDWLAARLPVGARRVYVSLWLRQGSISAQVVPWLTVYLDHGSRTFALRLLRLPGAKFVELWNPLNDEWMVEQK